MLGRPMHAVRAGQAIGAHGIPPRAALTATWQQLVRQAPPSVLAKALGISPVTAMRHANRAGTDYLAYPSLKGCRVWIVSPGADGGCSCWSGRG
jgi:hypothetical protein